MKYCEDQKRNDSQHSCIGRPQSRRRNQSKPVETDTVGLEGTHIPHGQPFQLEVKLGEWSVGRRIDCTKHKTGLFLLSSESARIVIGTAYDRLERIRRRATNGTGQAQLSTRQELHFLLPTDSQRKASALDKVVTSAGEVLFEKNLPTSIKLEAA